jgi:hypothetical protein
MSDVFEFSVFVFSCIVQYDTVHMTGVPLFLISVFYVMSNVFEFSVFVCFRVFQ